jgi:hypothetical protein
VSHDERAYNSYIRFCQRVQVTPMTFESWYLVVEELEQVQQ